MLPSGNILCVDQPFLDYLGFTHGDVTGKPFSSFVINHEDVERCGSLQAGRVATKAHHGCPALAATPRLLQCGQPRLERAELVSALGESRQLSRPLSCPTPPLPQHVGGGCKGQCQRLCQPATEHCPAAAQVWRPGAGAQQCHMCRAARFASASDSSIVTVPRLPRLLRQGIACNAPLLPNACAPLPPNMLLPPAPRQPLPCAWSWAAPSPSACSLL